MYTSFILVRTAIPVFWSKIYKPTAIYRDVARVLPETENNGI